jgi:phosphoribosyl-ATP pyrophosphohydrolase
VSSEVLDKLWLVIQDRKKNPSEKSYTCKLLKDSKKLESKIREECEELLKSKKIKGKDSTRWEAADLLYHVMVYLASKDVDFKDVLAELEGRMK